MRTPLGSRSKTIHEITRNITKLISWFWLLDLESHRLPRGGTDSLMGGGAYSFMRLVEVF
jgi:hypothetical protein